MEHVLFKILVVGEVNTGKTCMIHRYVKNRHAGAAPSPSGLPLGNGKQGDGKKGGRGGKGGGKKGSKGKSRNGDTSSNPLHTVSRT